MPPLPLKILSQRKCSLLARLIAEYQDLRNIIFLLPVHFPYQDSLSLLLYYHLQLLLRILWVSGVVR